MQNQQSPQVQPLVIGGVYEHYKGKHYRVLNLVRHSETLEEMVYYETLYECELGQFWVRPKDLFLGALSDGSPRFKLIQST